MNVNFYMNEGGTAPYQSSTTYLLFLSDYRIF